MKFGDAIEMMRDGHKVARSGWNGKGMYVFLESSIEAYEPMIVMRTAQGRLQPGWLASQPDILADDWEQVSTNYFD